MDWLVLAQAVLTVVTIFLAWRALVAARETVVLARESNEEAKRERTLYRLERVRVIVGELERLQRFGGDTARRERTFEELGTLLPSLGAHKLLPKTTTLAHWSPKLEGAEELLDAARLEVDAAIEKRLKA
jgi:hypothetical protein